MKTPPPIITANAVQSKIIFHFMSFPLLLNRIKDLAFELIKYLPEEALAQLKIFRFVIIF